MNRPLLSLPKTVKRSVHETLELIDKATPGELRELATELIKHAQEPASKISMRPTYRAMAKLLREASQL